MIDEKQWSGLIRVLPIEKGDFFQIEPGTVHAIKGGTLILETQQNSDITYRLYDYDRLSNGKPRELHIEKSRLSHNAEKCIVGIKQISHQQFLPFSCPEPGRDAISSISRENCISKKALM